MKSICRIYSNIELEVLDKKGKHRFFLNATTHSRILYIEPYEIDLTEDEASIQYINKNYRGSIWTSFDSTKVSGYKGEEPYYIGEKDILKVSKITKQAKITSYSMTTLLSELPYEQMIELLHDNNLALNVR